MKKLVLSLLVCSSVLISGWFISSYATQSTVSEQHSGLSDKNIQKLDNALEWIYKKLEKTHSTDNDAIISVLDKLIIELRKYSEEDERYISIVSYLVDGISEKIEEYAEVKVMVDVVYDETCEKCSLDIYYKNNNIQDKKVIFFVHWWAWKLWDKWLHEIKWSYFAEENYVFVSVNYTLFPQAVYKKQAEEIAKAFSYVHSNMEIFGWNKDDIVMMWHSAWWHLISLLSTKNNYLEKEWLSILNVGSTILLDSAGLDISWIKKAAPLTFKIVYKDVFWSVESELIEASPISHISTWKSIPEFLIFYSNERNNIENIPKSFHEKLKLNNIESTIYPISKSHEEINEDIWTSWDIITQNILEFLR